jgi:hypothetical protein
MAKLRKRKATSPAEEDRAMSPAMRQLILRFDAKTPPKKQRARDSRGRFTKSR